MIRKYRLKSPPFIVIGLGKGAEIDYGSDLDIIRRRRGREEPAETSNHGGGDFVCVEPTEMGVVFHADARLRPDGAQKGLWVHAGGV